MTTQQEILKKTLEMKDTRLRRSEEAQKLYDLNKRKNLILRVIGSTRNKLPDDMVDSFVYAVSAYAVSLMEAYQECPQNSSNIKTEQATI